VVAHSVEVEGKIQPLIAERDPDTDKITGDLHLPPERKEVQSVLATGWGIQKTPVTINEIQIRVDLATVHITDRQFLTVISVIRTNLEDQQKDRVLLERLRPLTHDQIPGRTIEMSETIILLLQKDSPVIPGIAVIAEQRTIERQHIIVDPMDSPGVQTAVNMAETPGMVIAAG